MCTVCEQQPGLVTAADFFFSGYLIVLCHSSVVWWVGGLSGRMAICSVCVWQHYCPAQITKCLRVTPGAFTKCWWQIFSLLHPFHRAILRALSTSAKIGLSGRLWDVEAAKDFLLETVLCLSFVLRGKYFCSLIYFFFLALRKDLSIISLKPTLILTDGNHAIMHVLLEQEISDTEIQSLGLSRVSIGWYCWFLASFECNKLPNDSFSSLWSKCLNTVSGFFVM